MERSIDTPNIAMADTLMAIFGYKRVSPTDEELKLKYKDRKKEYERVENFLEDL